MFVIIKYFLLGIIAYVNSCVYFIALWDFVVHFVRNFTRNCPDPMVFNEQPGRKVSIIIPVKNDAKDIARTMINFENTTIDKSNVELVLVDCGSEDNTADIVKSTTGAISVKIVSCNSNNRGSAVNLGVSRCCGDIVLLVRPDCLLPPGYDETLRRTFLDTSVILSYFQLEIESSKADPVSPLRKPQGLLPSLYSKWAVWLISFFQNIRSSTLRLPSMYNALATRKCVLVKRPFSDDIIMEDICWVRGLREVQFTRNCIQVNDSLISGRFAILQQSVVSTAMIRKYTILGFIKYSVLEGFSYALLLLLHVSTVWIHYWCYVLYPKATKFVHI